MQRLRKLSPDNLRQLLVLDRDEGHAPTGMPCPFGGHPTLNHEKPAFTVRTIFTGIIGRPRPEQRFLDEVARILRATGVVPRHKVQTPPAGANEPQEGRFHFGHSQNPNPEVVLY